MFIEIYNHIFNPDNVKHITWGHEGDEDARKWTITIEWNDDRPTDTFPFDNEKQRNECVHKIQNILCK